MCGSLCLFLHPVLASSFPLLQDFSKRASFPIACAECFYKKAVWSVVKSWEFEGSLRCSRILRIRRKNPMKWVLSISRDYWVYLDITLQSFKIWECWGEFWGIETFYRSKFSPATGVNVLAKNRRNWQVIFMIQASKSPKQDFRHFSGAKVCYSHGNVRFENFIYVQWSKEMFLKGIAGDKRRLRFWNKHQKTELLFSQLARYNRMHGRVLKYQKIIPENLAIT